MRNIFEDSCTEEGTGSVKDIFEGWFKFSASEARRKFDSTASAGQIEKDWSAYPSTQEYQKIEGKMMYDLTREQLGSDWDVMLW